MIDSLVYLGYNHLMSNSPYVIRGLLHLEKVRADLKVVFRDYRGDDYPCALCGKVCPNPTFSMHFIEGALYVAALAEDRSHDNDPGSMGHYPVGPGCARKIKKLVGPEVWAMYANQDGKQ